MCCRLFALGVTMYGQMTAGSYCYIGPQVITFCKYLLPPSLTLSVCLYFVCLYGMWWYASHLPIQKKRRFSA